MENEEKQLNASRWKAQAVQEKKEIYAQLDRIDSGELDAPSCREMCAQLRTRLNALKRDRDVMVGLLAEETTFIGELETRLKEAEHRLGRRFRLLPPAPTNAQIDYAEKKSRHFAQGLSPYKVFWVFFIGCFAGVLIERLWCLIQYGRFEPRVGLIYGPFNLVYGIGAALLSLALYPVRNRGKLLSFIGGAIVGSAVEYGCSLFQEMAFGSTSWDYSSYPFNLNGRICLQYAIYWGVLGVLWIKELYPRLAKLILKIPNRAGRKMTYALAVFMVVNTVMTALTVLRWVERRQGVPAGGRVEAYFDEHYPDERMEAIFSNLEFVDEKE